MYLLKQSGSIGDNFVLNFIYNINVNVTVVTGCFTFQEQKILKKTYI